MKHNRMQYRFWGQTPPTADKRVGVRAEVTPKTDGQVATIRLYDPIDPWGDIWGVSAREMVTALDELSDDVNEIRLHINSPGGDVFEGIAILNALRAHDARVVAVVDALAASAASFIATGVDELVMGRNSQLMIHDAWGFVVGPAADMRDMADRLDQHSNNIASIYADKAGGDLAAWRAAMLAESWYLPDEAVAAGLADSVAPAPERKPADNPGGTQDRWDLSIYDHQGRAAAPPPPMPATALAPPAPKPPSAAAAGSDAMHELELLELSVALAG